MQWVGRAELVAAVANAGALGFITALTQPTPADLSREIQKTRELTDKPFGVNLTILPAINPPPYDEYRQVIVDEGIKIVETAGSNPAPHLPMFHDNGIKVLHKCTSVRHAVKAQSLGVDGISIDGFECAGHPGEDDDAGPGADPRRRGSDRDPDDRLRRLRRRPRPGRRVGARCRRHQHGLAVHVHRRVLHPPERQDAIVAGNELGTELIFRSLHNTARVASNAVSREVVEILKGGGQFDDVRIWWPVSAGRRVFDEGDVDAGIWTVGTAMGLINDIPTVGELVSRIVTEAEGSSAAGWPAWSNRVQTRKCPPENQAGILNAMCGTEQTRQRIAPGGDGCCRRWVSWRWPAADDPRTAPRCHPRPERRRDKARRSQP